MDDTSDIRPHPWRWMILFSRFLWSFICVGSFKSLGVFIPHFVESFSATTAAAGFVCSLTLGFGDVIAGPFAGVLLKICDPRKLTIVGGLVSAFSTCAAACSSSITLLAVWFSLSSVGMAVIQVASIKPITDYFPVDFSFANGVSLAGGTVGMMILPPVVEYLVSLYGWRNTLGLMGALSFNYVVSGALLRPLHKSKTACSLLSNQSNYDTIPTMSKELTDKKVYDWNLVDVLKEQFDTKILATPVFIMYQVVAVLCGCAFSMWHLFVVPQGVEMGYGDAPSAFLATFGGIGSLIGRLGHGPFVDRRLIKASTLFILASLVFGASCLMDPLAVSSYAALVTNCFVSGIAIGVFYPLTYVIFHEVTGDQHMSAFGWLFSSTGAGYLLGGAFAGWIHDVAKAYDIVFMATGAFSFTMAAIVAVTRCLESCCHGND